MTVIANTTIISNYCSVDRLDILKAVLSQVYIPTEVYAEIQDGLAEGYSFLSRYRGLHPSSRHRRLAAPDVAPRRRGIEAL